MFKAKADIACAHSILLFLVASVRVILEIDKNLTRIILFLPLLPYWLRLALDGHQDQNGILQICHKTIFQPICLLTICQKKAFLYQNVCIFVPKCMLTICHKKALFYHGGLTGSDWPWMAIKTKMVCCKSATKVSYRSHLTT